MNATNEFFKGMRSLYHKKTKCEDIFLKLLQFFIKVLSFLKVSLLQNRLYLPTVKSQPDRIGYFRHVGHQ